jgi:asparagine N-glycosylation enzyme membrane subunit Stt3
MTEAPLFLLTSQGIAMRGAIIATALPAVAALVALFLELRKDTPLTQARFYLQFPMLHRVHYFIIVAVACIIAFNLAYTALGLSFVTRPGMFYPFGIYVILLHVLFIALALFIIATMGGRAPLRRRK